MVTVADARAFVRRNPYAVLVAVAMSLVLCLAAIETSGMLPLEGQARPMYGTMPMPGTTVRRKPTVTKPNLKDARRAARMRRSSSSRLR